MTKLQTLKLGASAIGGAAPRQTPPAAPVELPAEPVETVVVESVAAPMQAEAPLASEPASVAVLPRIGRRNMLLALLALSVVATLAAVEATGAIHSGLIRGLTFVVIVIAAAAVLAGAAVAYKRQHPESAGPTAGPAAKKKFSSTKAVLMLMMAAGIAVYFGGAGTFAGFTAETTNPNDSLASGTLALDNAVGAAAACHSYTGESTNNVNANCTQTFAFTNQEPGVYAGTATITLTNSGSLPASKLYLWAPFSNGVLSAGITSGNPVATLNLYASGHGPAGLEGPVSTGDAIVVTSGANSQTFCVGANAAAGATSVTITGVSGCGGLYTNVAAYTFAAGATVSDQSTDTTATNTNCYDTQQTVYSFNPATGNPLCVAGLLYVQETTGGFNYCWYGNNTGAPTGGCTAPISTSPSAGLSGGTVVNGAYTVAALTGNIATNDHLYFTQNGNVMDCKSSGNYYVGATSITVNSCAVNTGTNTGYTNSVVITDNTTLNTLASDSTHTVSQFDIHKNYNLKQELAPVSANGTLTPTGTDLATGAPNARTFVVGVFIPGPAVAQNQLQGLKSTFGLTWHIDQ
jgi:hypothetical protein